jgi:hypothetical protein
VRKQRKKITFEKPYPKIWETPNTKSDVGEENHCIQPMEMMLVIRWPDEYTRAYWVLTHHPYRKPDSEIQRYISFLESCVDRLAAIYLRQPGAINWAVINDGVYDEILYEFGFTEETFEKFRIV